MTAKNHLPPQTKAFFFDLDGTIRENRPSAIEMILDELALRAYPTSPELVKRIVRSGHAFWGDQEQIKQFKFSVDDERVFWSQFFATYLQVVEVADDEKKDISWKLGSEFLANIHSSDSLIEDAIPTLIALRKRGYLLGLVSNRSQTLDEPVYRLGLGDYFDFTLSAGQANSWKPDPRIYQVALQKAGDLKPEEAVYIGDNYYTDIIGAIEAGLFPILYDIYDAFDGVAACLRIKQLNELLAIS